MSRRLEITVSDETWARLDVARGHEPRASFVKRALEKALGDGPVGVQKPEVSRERAGHADDPVSGGSAPSRASLSTHEKEQRGLRNIAEVSAQSAAMERQRKLNEARARKK